MTQPSGPRRYEFGPPEDRSVLAGLDPLQLTAAAGGLLAAVLLLRVLPPTMGLPAALAMVTITAAGVLWQIAGRPTIAWTGALASWAWRRLRGRTRYRLNPHPTTSEAVKVEVDVPEPLDGVTVYSYPMPWGPVGVIQDRRAGTWVAVLQVAGQSLALADAYEKDRRLAAWGGVLAGLSRPHSPIARLQWVQHTLPDDPDALGRYLAKNHTVASGHPSLASYIQLVDTRRARRHRRAHPPRRRHLREEGAQGDQGGRRRPDRRVPGAAIGSPAGRRPPRRRRRTRHRDPGPPPARRHPASRHPHPPPPQRRRRPRLPPGPRPDRRGRGGGGGWVAARCGRRELGGGALRRRLACHLLDRRVAPRRRARGLPRPPPVRRGRHEDGGGDHAAAATGQAIRQVEAAQVAHHADEELRRRGGFLPTARRAAPHKRSPVGRPSSPTATATTASSATSPSPPPTRDQLDRSCGEVEQAAGQANLELVRLYGQQHTALTWTLPLARGLQ